MYVLQPKRILRLIHNVPILCTMRNMCRDSQHSRLMGVRPAARGFTAGSIQNPGTTVQLRVSLTVTRSFNGAIPHPLTDVFSIIAPQQTRTRPPRPNPQKTHSMTNTNNNVI